MIMMTSTLLLLATLACIISHCSSESSCVSSSCCSSSVARSEMRVLKLEKLLGDTQQEVRDLKQAVQALISAQAQTSTNTQLQQTLHTLSMSVAELNQTVSWIINPPSPTPSVSASMSISASLSPSPSSSASSSASLYSSPSISTSSTASRSVSATQSKSPSASPSVSPSVSLSAPPPFTIRGNVLLTGSDQGDKSLSNVTRVDGNVTIAASSLDAVPTFDKLQEITGSLVIQLNSNLVSLARLSSLRWVGGDLFVWKNTAMRGLSGLDSLVSVGGSVTITTNSQLTSLTGLGSLASVNGSFAVTLNTQLASLTGLSSLVSVGGSVVISSNSQLTNLTLGSLVYVGASLSVTSNANLTTTMGLGSLVRVDGDFYVHDNNMLVNVTGLSSLAWIGGSFSVNRNTNLNAVDIRSNNVLNIRGRLGITFNSFMEYVNITVSSTSSVYIVDSSYLSALVLDTLVESESILVATFWSRQDGIPMKISFAALRRCNDLWLYSNYNLAYVFAPLLQTIGTFYLNENFGYAVVGGGVNMTSLTRIERDLSVANNPYLTNLDFLTSLAQSGIGVAGGSVNVGGSITIKGNGVNCVNWNYIQYPC